jgi:hypothetical protein
MGWKVDFAPRARGRLLEIVRSLAKAFGVSLLAMIRRPRFALAPVARTILVYTLTALPEIENCERISSQD